MNQNICIPLNYFLVLILFFIILTIIYLYYRDNLLNIENNNLIKKKSNFNNKKFDLDILPVRQLLENRDKSILYDPLIAPERRIDINQYPIPIQNIINIPPNERSPDNYQLIGIGTRDLDEKIIQIFGRPTFPRSNQYEYYIITSTDGFVNKIPINVKGKKELYDGDSIYVHKLGEFKVKLYNYNTPRYNPYIL